MRADEDSLRIRRRLEKLAWLLDAAIPLPGLNVRIGLDSLLGLLPALGDTAGALASGYILREAARLGAPRSVLLKMAFNIVIDALLGAVPLLGDIFDFAWKANLRNIRLLEAYLDEPRRTRRASRLFVGGLTVLIAAFVLLIAVLTIFIVRWLWQVLTPS